MIDSTIRESNNLHWFVMKCQNAEKIEAQRARFTTAYGIIEKAGLESEYADWLETK